MVWSVKSRPKPDSVTGKAEQSQDWPTVINWRDRVYEAVEHLEDFPEAGTIVRELNRKDIREVIVGDYRVIYRVKRRTPEVISVRHGHFLIRSILSL